MSIPLVRTRRGSAQDQHRAVALHARCAEATLRDRYHAPMPPQRERIVAATLEPQGGWSLVAEIGDDLVAIASTGPISATDLEVGMLVEDAHQGRGIGSRMLRELADEAVTRGFRTLLCLTQPGNQAVPGAARKAGLPFVVEQYDGVAEVVVALPTADLEMPVPA